MIKRFIPCLLACYSSLLLAETEPALEPLPTVEPSEPGDASELITPEISIIDGAKARVEEYRVNGQLYMLKVTPKQKGAKPYYFVDSNGDGTLDVRHDGPAGVDGVNLWKLFEF